MPNCNFPLLTTDRLILSAPDSSAGAAIFEIHSDARTYEHRPDLVMVSHEQATLLRHEWQQNWAEDGLGYFVVSHKEDPSRIIGFCGVSQSQERNEDVLNVYYRFSPDSQDRGYAYEATTAAIDWSRRQCAELPVIAIIDPANSASIKLAERLGLSLVKGSGIPGDYDVYRR